LWVAAISGTGNIVAFSRNEHINSAKGLFVVTDMAKFLLPFGQLPGGRPLMRPDHLRFQASPQKRQHYRENNYRESDETKGRHRKKSGAHFSPSPATRSRRAAGHENRLYFFGMATSWAIR